MKIKDWERLRAKAQTIQKKRREFSSFAWAMVGLAITSVFALVAWVPAYAVMPIARQLDYSWVSPSFIAAAIAGVVMATLAFWAAHLFAVSERLTAAELVSDMDGIFAPDGHRSARPQSRPSGISGKLLAHGSVGPSSQN